jgi:aspartate-semialdehyde dehydrogenase
MVGSVLMQRMIEEQDFKNFQPVFFSSSQAGQVHEIYGFSTGVLEDAYDIKTLCGMDIILSCQGGDYTERVFPQMEAAGFRGHWIDAASTLRMRDDSVIVLDPVNGDLIARRLAQGGGSGWEATAP